MWENTKLMRMAASLALPDLFFKRRALEYTESDNALRLTKIGLNFAGLHDLYSVLDYTYFFAA